ncbi:MAG: hypothetical protein QNL07_06345 [Candidatus Planktophila sp.]
MIADRGRLSLREMRYQLTDHLRKYFYSDRGLIRLASRFIFLTISAGALVLISSAIADELNLISDSVQEEALAPPEVEVVAISDTSTVTEELIMETVTAVVTPEPEPVILAPVVITPEEDIELAGAAAEVSVYIDDQPQFRMIAPASIPVDPRAKSAFIPRLQFSGAETVLACFNGNGIAFDIAQVRSNDDQNVGDYLIDGDQSSALRISGDIALVRALINSGNGLFTYSAGAAIAAKSFTFSLVALNEPSTDFELCSGARTSTSSVFRALGIAISTKKGGGSLK